MQGLLDFPRNTGINKGEVLTLLRGGPAVSVGYGLEMHWPTSAAAPNTAAMPVFDISSCITNGSVVEYDNTAKLSGTANLVIDPAAWEALGRGTLLQEYVAPNGAIPGPSRAFYWGSPRTQLRPYMTLESGLLSAKFYLGAYIPATPTAGMDGMQPLYNVTCYELTSIFDIPLITDLSYLAGTNICDTINFLIQTVTQVFGGYAPYTWVNFVTTTLVNGKTMNLAMSWPADGTTTYLDVINGLLAQIGYYPLYTDCYGYIQATSWVDPRVGPIGYTFDTTDRDRNIVDLSGTWTPDIWAVPNKWVFLLQGSPGAPVEGNGQYTLINQSNGPSSIDRQLGRIVLSQHQINAATQADLVTQGNSISVQESMLGETLTFNTSPLPIAGHADNVLFISDNIESNQFAASGPTNVRRCAVQSWHLPLNGDPMSWTIGTVG